MNKHQKREMNQSGNIESVESANNCKERYRFLDFYKGIVTILMVCAHVIMWFSVNMETMYFTEYVNLTTFSAFMFALGFASDSHYISEKTKNWKKKLIKKAVFMYGAFCLSSLLYEGFIGAGCSAKVTWEIAILKRIPGFSEFLISFAVLYIILPLFQSVLANMEWRRYISYVIIALLATYLPYDQVKNPLLGVLIGGSMHRFFPLLQYSCYFVSGVMFSQKKIIFNWKMFVSAAIGSIIFMRYIVVHNTLPDRFPPSAFWIVGAAFFVYCYYLLSREITSRKQNRVTWFVETIGKHTLSYLIISNMLIFCARRIVTEQMISVTEKQIVCLCVSLSVICIMIPFAGNLIIEKFKRRRKVKEKSC